MGAEPETTVDPDPGADTVEVTMEFEAPLTKEALRERCQGIADAVAEMEANDEH